MAEPDCPIIIEAAAYRHAGRHIPYHGLGAGLTQAEINCREPCRGKVCVADLEHQRAVLAGAAGSCGYVAAGHDYGDEEIEYQEPR